MLYSKPVGALALTSALLTAMAEPWLRPSR
jgi:hypothetical protein